ncbi:UNVERIFIED_CONTAM: B3 domain-containing protein [Sesamum calycinum]|uniref:B3 domain-containing protein n=1 Tax=Sesamum calycinum TaxID=2727403 RepID=A0AAW2MDQ9_9LAMI
MASSSRLSCFHCQDASSNPDHFRNGWRLRSGEYAQLCPRCASVYEEGRFCETFHSNDDGWRDCESLWEVSPLWMYSIFQYSFALGFWRDNLHGVLKARNRCLSLEPEIRAKEPYQERTGQALLEAQCWRRVTDLDLQQVFRNPKATVTPLFEKILSASDADLKLARLIIPKRCAEAFFPDISALHGLRIKIQDTEGNEWEFHYRYWLNGGSRIYVLEGLRDYMVSKKWQPGDTVCNGRSKTPFLFNVLRKALVSKRKSRTLLLIAKNQMIERRKPVCQLQRDTAVTRSIRPHCICAATRLRRLEILITF